MDGLLNRLLAVVSEHEVVRERRPGVTEVRIGILYTAVLLSTGHAGVSHSGAFEAMSAAGCGFFGRLMPDAGTLTEKPFQDLLAHVGDSNPLKGAVGVAVLNALSALIIESAGHGHQEYPNMDALDLLEITPRDRVVLVGAFPPFIRRLREQVKELHVLERNPGAFEGENLGVLLPEDRAAEVLPGADIVVASGTTVSNGTLEGLISLSQGAREFLLVGPTAGMLPDPLFQAGVTVIGGIRIRNPERLLRLVSEGGSGHGLNRDCAVKITIKKRP
ncbi:MAG: DUF364 domain-containing protein [Firmicutes bacterium]|nr:DUF364 domain-containing protein [Bacillota bacterium]